ncbi:hypothetical protein PFLmoz3_04143 [Pseudomonas fluorescens]|uniref:Uncharacterized protein n=1 Tax=Pseudomonas fluorescens TaxID=294 RepID=A0A120G6V1_PSEFL|nr:hypothetical protein PFLmoz3_04143 [Pseudomonas fluorescens]
MRLAVVSAQSWLSATVTCCSCSTMLGTSGNPKKWSMAGRKAAKGASGNCCTASLASAPCRSLSGESCHCRPSSF